MTNHTSTNETNSSDDPLRQFLLSHKSLMLATVDRSGNPLCSYAPFVLVDRELFVFVSQLAAHTANLFADPRCHAMVIDDEQQSLNQFGRKRLSFVCHSQPIARGDQQFAEILAIFRQRFGPVVDMLESLPDFHLFRLTTGEGNFVQGFGKAASVRLAEGT